MKRVLSVMIVLAASALADWTHIGPDGAQVQSIGRDPANPLVLYAATYSYPAYPEAFVSRDGGETWHAGGKFPLWEIGRLTVDRDRDSIVYGHSRGYFMTRTTDAGASWQMIEPPGHMTGLLSDRFSPGRVWASGVVEPGVALPAAFLSTDYGETWRAIVADSAPGSATCITGDPVHPNWIYLGADSGRVLRTTDVGVSWHSRSAGLAHSNDVLSLDISPADPALLLAGTYDGVFRTTDAGDTWLRADGPEKVIQIAFSAADPQVAWALGRDTAPRAWYSTDAGASWSAAQPDTMLRVRCTHMNLDPRDPAVALFNCWRGIVRTTDWGQSFAYHNPGLRGNIIHAMGVHPTDPDQVWVAAQDHQLFGTEDGGQSWRRLNSFWCIENGMCCALALAPHPEGDLLYAFEGYG